MPERTYPCCDCCAADLPHIERDTHTLPCDICHPSPVQRALMAIAWDEGVAAMTQAAVLARNGRTAEARAAILSNPYRTAHAAELHDSTEPKGPTMPNNNTDVPPESWPFPPYVILNLGGESRTYWPRAAQGVPASQCGPDDARPADGIVSVAHYWTEGGER